MLVIPFEGRVLNSLDGSKAAMLQRASCRSATPNSVTDRLSRWTAGVSTPRVAVPPKTVAIDQYAEAATGNREYFLNKGLLDRRNRESDEAP
jgi:hypothetical protein